MKVGNIIQTYNATSLAPFFLLVFPLYRSRLAVKTKASALRAVLRDTRGPSVVGKRKKEENSMVFPVLSTKIIDGVMDVHRSLCPGLLEVCYHNSLYYEYKAMGLQVFYNAPFTVTYKGDVVGEYQADLKTVCGVASFFGTLS